METREERCDGEKDEEEKLRGGERNVRRKTEKKGRKKINEPEGNRGLFEAK